MSIKSHKEVYHNTIKPSSKLIIEEIYIIEWLKYWGLEHFYEILFVTPFNILIKDGPKKNTWEIYKYDKLLKKIKTNIDLLFSFHSIENFIVIITPIIYSKLYHEAEEIEELQETFFDDVENVISIFYSRYYILFNEKRDYKEYLSILELNSTKNDYINLIDTSDMLDFLDTSFYKDKRICKQDIINKLKMLSFRDMVNSDRWSFRIFLSVPIELCELFLKYTKDKINMKHHEHHLNIKSHFNKSMPNVNFKRIVETHMDKTLKMFESSDNNFYIKQIKEMIIQKYDAESFINSSRMDLLTVLISPKKLILNEVANNIYNYIFPDNDSKFIDSQFKKIPKIIPPLKEVNTKCRIFFIQGHGIDCSLEEYKKIRDDRVDFTKVNLKIVNKIQQLSEKTNVVGKIIKYKTNLSIISNQPLGRVSYSNYLPLFNSLFSSRYRDKFLKGLLNSTKIEHLRIMESIVTMLYYNDLIIQNKIFKEPYIFNENFIKYWHTEYVKKSYLKEVNHKSFGDFVSYTPSDITSDDIVNFVKYDDSQTSYPPLNSTYSFKQNYATNSDIQGIFELSKDNFADLENLNNKIKALPKTKDKKIRLGLQLNSIYEFSADIPNNIDDILKYNRQIINDEYKLEEIIEMIYNEGDIKSDEHVVIFSNLCRGLVKPGITDNGNGNTTTNFNTSSRDNVRGLRLNSYERTLNNITFPQKLMNNQNNINEIDVLNERTNNINNQNNINNFNEEFYNVNQRRFNKITTRKGKRKGKRTGSRKGKRTGSRKGKQNGKRNRSKKKGK